jgi:hypothetical protein
LGKRNFSEQGGTSVPTIKARALLQLKGNICYILNMYWYPCRIVLIRQSFKGLTVTNLQVYYITVLINIFYSTGLEVVNQIQKKCSQRLFSTFHGLNDHVTLSLPLSLSFSHSHTDRHKPQIQANTHTHTHTHTHTNTHTHT